MYGLRVAFADVVEIFHASTHDSAIASDTSGKDTEPCTRPSPIHAERR